MMSHMGGDGRRRWAASPVVMVAIPVAIGLVGNLATSTVQRGAWWWVPLTWTVTALLVGAAVLSQIAQPTTRCGRYWKTRQRSPSRTFSHLPTAAGRRDARADPSPREPGRGRAASPFTRAVKPGS